MGLPEHELIERCLADLEWPRLLQELARRCMSEAGQRAALSLRPASSPEEVRTRQTTVGELLELAEAGAELPVSALQDARESLLRIEKGGVPSGVELACIIRILRVSLELFRFGKAHRERAPQLARVLTVDSELAGLLVTLERAVSSEGEILDQASLDLAEARGKVRSLRRRVQSRVSDLISKYRDALQDGYFAERDGRYVLPVRADAPFRVEGFVFGTSQSGSTLYIEPKELAQLGHDFRLAEAFAEQEEARVLAQLAGEVLPFVSEVTWAEELCARADLLAAIVRFSRATNAMVVPLSEHALLDLRGACHPLLLLSEGEVVRSDLRVECGKGLVISGPNAGGKTVALKAMGVLALMQSSGLPLPVAEGSEVGYFPVVLADIGDDQSLSQSLSTFSGLVERVVDFLERADVGVLIVLDELMGGTDPAEGAVLAMATIEEMTRRGAAVVVTTHYDALKEFAAAEDSMTSAAVGFDFERFEPTFLVEMGRPGASSALFVARRHGLPQRVLDRAEAYLPEVDARVRRDRIEIEQLRVGLTEQARQLALKLDEQSSLNRSLENQVRLAKEARARDLSRETDELRQAIRDARAELRSVRSKVRGVPSAEEIRMASRAIDQISSVVSLGSEVDRAVRELDSAPLTLELRPGMKVRVKKLRALGEVLEAPKKGQVRVLMGSVKLTVPLGDLDLELAKPSVPQGARPKAQARSLPTPSGAIEPPVPVRSEDVILDLRGKRVEAALDELDGFIDRLLQRHEPGGFVLHGHGTGAMKEAVRSHLRSHPCLQRSRPAEREDGGDAFTIFWLSGL